jgi:hypothetical protein
MSADPTTAFNEIVQHVQREILAEVYARVVPIPMLAHYTSIDALDSILCTKELWFSRVRDMTDTCEMTAGASIVASALSEYGPEIFKALPYSDLNVENEFETRRLQLETETYAMSLCEHGSDEETDRLVMWRAYGHNGSGLCLVLRKDTLLGQTAGGKFPVHWSPIYYASSTKLAERLKSRLRQVEAAFRAHPQCVAAVPTPLLGMLVAGCAVAIVLGHKHLAFKDEREIRLVRSPLLQRLRLPEGASYREVGGTEKPKKVFVLPLRQYPEFGIKAGLRDLVDHVIVGPSFKQEPMCREVRTLLDSHDLQDVPIRCSEIPYRAEQR